MYNEEASCVKHHLISLTTRHIRLKTGMKINSSGPLSSPITNPTLLCLTAGFLAQQTFLATEEILGACIRGLKLAMNLICIMDSPASAKARIGATVFSTTAHRIGPGTIARKLEGDMLSITFLLALMAIVPGQIPRAHMKRRLETIVSISLEGDPKTTIISSGSQRSQVRSGAA